MNIHAVFNLILFVFVSISTGQSVSGTVTDEEGNPLIGANVYVEDTFIGTTTNLDGEYFLETNLEFPFTLVVSYIGYDMKKIEVTNVNFNVTLVEKAFMANEVVVAASRIKESYLSAPVSVEKLDLLDIKRTPSVSFYDALDNLKEVEMKTGSFLYKSMNARGFGGTTNSNFIQLVDGANNAPIASGQFAIGNMLGIPEIDIASVELLPGAASALYGPNAYSGIMFINSKTPFFYQGLSAEVKTGVTSEDEAGTNPYHDISFRYAKAYDRLAFKTSFSSIKAHDWHAYDDSYVVDSNGDTSGFNQVNYYGDEMGQDFDLGPLGIVPIGRTGYTENELYDYNVENIKYSGSLQYKITDDLMASYIYRYAEGQTLFQSLNKYILKGISGQYHQAELKSSKFTLRAVNFAEDAGEAYDMLFTSFNINRAAKHDNAWFYDYIAAYTGQLSTFGINGQDADIARNYADNGILLPDGALYTLDLDGDGVYDGFADATSVDGEPDLVITTPIDINGDGIPDPYAMNLTGDIVPYSLTDAKPRFEAGSDEFNDASQNSIETPYSIGGSGFTSTSQYNDLEAMYDFGDEFGVVDLLVGGNYKMYRPETGGTIYSDTPEIVSEHGHIEVNEWGAYAQISKLLLEDRLKLQASCRADGHTNFDTHLSPRFSAVYSINDFQHLRMSYQEGFTNPTIQNQYLAINLGVQHNIGGAIDNIERLGLSHLYDGNEEGVFGIRDTDGDGITYLEYDTDNDGIIDSIWFDGEALNYIEPEYQKSFEVGFKGLITQDLYLDVNYYTGEYTNPGAGYRVGDPNQIEYNEDGTVDDYYEYIIASNKEGIDRLHGGGVALTYNFSNGWRIGANTNYIDMNISLDEANEQQTDRPKFRHKFSISNPNVIDNLGFSLAGRYTDKFEYSSSSNFGNGELGGHTIIDAQLTYSLTQFNTTVKLGINNLIGETYREAIGGVSIGQTMYLAMSFDKLF